MSVLCSALPMPTPIRMQNAKMPIRHNKESLMHVFQKDFAIDSASFSACIACMHIIYIPFAVLFFMLASVICLYARLAGPASPAPPSACCFLERGPVSHSCHFNKFHDAHEKSCGRHGSRHQASLAPGAGQMCLVWYVRNADASCLARQWGLGGWRGACYTWYKNFEERKSSSLDSEVYFEKCWQNVVSIEKSQAMVFSSNFLGKPFHSNPLKGAVSIASLINWAWNNCMHLNDVLGIFSFFLQLKTNQSLQFPSLPMAKSSNLPCLLESEMNNLLLTEQV